MAIRNKAFSKVTALSNKVAEVELSKETVELRTRKAESILKDSKKVDDKLAKGEKKISKAFNVYKDVYSDFQNLLEETGRNADNLKADLNNLEAAAKEIGISVSDIDNYAEALKHVERMKELSGQFKYYPKP